MSVYIGVKGLTEPSSGKNTSFSSPFMNYLLELNPEWNLPDVTNLK